MQRLSRSFRQVQPVLTVFREIQQRYTGALAQVTAYAGQHEVFRQAWEAAVRQAADAVAAHIAGLWMAGQAHGTVAWDAAYPVLPAMDGEALEAAFQLAVHGEVSRRIKTMHGPGAFG